MAKSKKGPKWEREFCKMLSLWWTGGKMDDVFWRSTTSGARATIRMRKKQKTADSYGDVTSLRRIGKPLTKSTLMELKRGYTGKKGKRGTRFISILDMIDDTYESKKKKPVLIEWWKDAQRKRREAKRKRVFIIFRRDRRKGCIVMSRKTYDWLCKHNGKMMCPPYYGFSWITLKHVNIMVIKIEDFFDWCKPEVLGAPRIIKRRKK